MSLGVRVRRALSVAVLVGATGGGLLSVAPPGLAARPTPSCVNDTCAVTHLPASTVNTVVLSLAITTRSLAEGMVGFHYRQPVHASGGSDAGDRAWALTGGALPTGLQLDSRTGVIYGAATKPGTHTFTVTVMDAAGRTASRRYTLRISGDAIDVDPSSTDQLATTGAAPWLLAGAAAALLAIGLSVMGLTRLHVK